MNLERGLLYSMDECINAVSTCEEMNQNIEINSIVILYELKSTQ